MKKLFVFCLLFISFNFIKSSIDCNSVNTEGYTDLDEDICTFLPPDDSKGTHCCYLEVEDGDRMCYTINDDAYENIVRFRKYYEDNVAGGKDVKIKCSSQFMSLSIFALLALLF